MAEGDASLVLDADVLMNLWASGRLEDILRAGGREALICPRVEREALWVLGGDPGVREAVVLDPLFDAGILTLVVPTQTERSMMVELAARVDDGEAEAMAVAAARGHAFATDDRRATTVARSLGLDVPDTPSLARAWAPNASPAEIRSVLVRIEARARYAPRRDHPLGPWWIESLVH